MISRTARATVADAATPPFPVAVPPAAVRATVDESARGCRIRAHGRRWVLRGDSDDGGKSRAEKRRA